jgi:hypothetical protein
MGGEASTGSAVPTCVWRVTPALIERLETQLGPPLDSYVRGWQVWLEPNGPQGVTLEWRLHPPAGFAMPRGVDPHDLFDVVSQALAEAQDPAAGEALALGHEARPLPAVWEVLEAFPAFDDDVELAALIGCVTRALDGWAPDVAGQADHARLGDLWKSAKGDFSVGQALLAQLEAVPPPPQPPTGW